MSEQICNLDDSAAGGLGYAFGLSWNLPLDLCLECCGFDYDSAANPPMVSRLLGYRVSVDHLHLVLRERRLDLCHEN